MFSKILSKFSQAASPHKANASKASADANSPSESNRPDSSRIGKEHGWVEGKKPFSTARPVSHNKQKSGLKKQPEMQWDISRFHVPPEEGKTRFHEYDLPAELMRAIAELGFRYCSPIQAQSLPYTLKGGDVVGKAQTGTGKTAAFLIAVISDLLKNPIKGERYAGEARALVLAPTRELALQIGEDARALTKYCGLQVHTLVGGMDYQKQKLNLHSRLVDILVATPGRLMDFMDSRDVFLDEVECLVIDEADRMLDMGFIPQVKRIVRATPPRESRQTLLFSATFNQDVMNLSAQWTFNPVHIEIEPENLAADRVEQRVYMASSDEKFTILMNMLNRPDVQSMIVFANRRDICRDLFEKLKACGVSCGMLSGDVDQSKRVRTLEHFKSGQTRVLVATDVAGRGIHVDGVSHVVNYTLPETPDDYVHRIGRTGRGGACGISVSFACEDDGFLLPEIERLLAKKLICEMPPVELLKALPAEITQRAVKAERDSRRERRSQFGSNNKIGGKAGSGRGGSGRSRGVNGRGTRSR